MEGGGGGGGNSHSFIASAKVSALVLAYPSVCLFIAPLLQERRWIAWFHEPNNFAPFVTDDINWPIMGKYNMSRIQIGWHVKAVTKARTLLLEQLSGDSKVTDYKDSH